ncbi:CAP domain-containing protein [Anaerolentibacter hominis]|uniref:CAP domain-containing protein n=1 Tax=Anaerolentibacter hominis TaxID=3079009 RepID=UPI0031B85F97
MNHKRKWNACLLFVLVLFVLFSPATPERRTPATVEAASVKFNKEKLMLYVGNTFKLKLKGVSEKVVWSTSRKSVASVSQAGMVTAKGEGKAVITAKAGKKKYTAAVTVKKNQLTYTALKLGKGETRTLRLKGDGIKINWSSSDSKVVSVEKNGRISAKKEGKAVICAAAGGQNYYCQITVVPGESGAGKLKVWGRNLRIGDTAKAVVRDFGEPDRTDKSYYGDSTYIYKGSYTGYFMVYIQKGKVIGFYTDSEDFTYDGISYGDSRTKLSGHAEYDAEVFADDIGTGRVTGVRIMQKDIKPNEYTSRILKDMEQEIFDLTNSLRARNNLPLVKWSDQAAASALNHSRDMAEKDYFNHTSKDGKSPFDRMKKNGINYMAAGENIAAGYADSVTVCYQWFQSEGHRANLLDERFTYLGVGNAYAGDSYYKIYYTQNFYK